MYNIYIIYMVYNIKHVESSGCTINRMFFNDCLQLDWPQPQEETMFRRSDLANFLDESCSAWGDSGLRCRRGFQGDSMIGICSYASFNMYIYVWYVYLYIVTLYYIHRYIHILYASGHFIDRWLPRAMVGAVPTSIFGIPHRQFSDFVEGKFYPIHDESCLLATKFATGCSLSGD